MEEKIVALLIREFGATDSEIATIIADLTTRGTLSEQTALIEIQRIRSSWRPGSSPKVGTAVPVETQVQPQRAAVMPATPPTPTVPTPPTDVVGAILERWVEWFAKHPNASHHDRQAKLHQLRSQYEGRGK